MWPGRCVDLVGLMDDCKSGGHGERSVDRPRTRSLYEVILGTMHVHEIGQLLHRQLGGATGGSLHMTVFTSP